MQADLDALIELALRSPSGDNLQPFEVRRHGSELDLCFVRARASALFDIGDVASRLALGALIESFTLAGAARGIAVHATLDVNEAVWARLALSPMDTRPSALADAIPLRSTNRAPFDGSPLAPTVVEELARCGPRVEIFATREEVDRVADIVRIAETVRATIRRAHEDLQRCIRWTPEDAERTRDGLDVRTLGVTPVEQALLKLSAPWWRMRIFAVFGAARMQGRYAKKMAQSASAFAWIGVPDLTASSAIAAGRTMQRVWLTATSLGLEVSPFAAFPLLAIVNAQAPESLRPAQRRQLTTAIARERALRSDRDGTCAMLLRIGRAPRPTVRTLRHLSQEPIHDR